jgi:hypothetical protein
VVVLRRRPLLRTRRRTARALTSVSAAFTCTSATLAW